jgi:hypothetical protein
MVVDETKAGCQKHASLKTSTAYLRESRCSICPTRVPMARERTTLPSNFKDRLAAGDLDALRKVYDGLMFVPTA